MENIKKFFSQLKYELSQWFKDNKEDCIAFCVMVAFMIVAFSVIVLAVEFTEIFLSIVFILACIGIIPIIILITETSLDTYYYDAKYPLLKQIKHGFIRYVLYPIYVSITCLLVYTLLFH